MEDEKDLMSLFDGGQDLIFDYTPDNIDDQDNPDDIQDDQDNDIDDTAIDDDNQENVDSDDDAEEDEGSQSDTSPNLFSSVADVLKEQGLLPSLESSKNIKSIEDFTDVVNKEIETQATLRAEQYLNSLDVNKIASAKKELQSLETIDELYLKENLDYAKNIIYQDYINQGLSEDRATKLLKKTIDLGEEMVIEEAMESKQSLVEFNNRMQEQAKIEAAKRLEDEKRQQIELEKQLQQLVYKQDLIKGLPTTKAMQDRVYKSMTEIVSKNPETGEMENKFMKDRNANPVEFDARMYYLYELTNGFTDLTTISKSVGSKAVKNLEKALRQTRVEDSGIPHYLQDPNSYDSPFGSELVL